MALLFADEDFPFPAVEVLRSHGHDVLTTLEAGLAGLGTNDSEILAVATRLGRTVLTMNRRDFIQLYNIDPNHAGIVICKRNPDTDDLALQIDAVINTTSTLLGQLLRVNRLNSPH